MVSNRKVWGIKHRILDLHNLEADLLYLEKDTACSIHYHKKKINRFILLKGAVSVNTDLGIIFLEPNLPFDADPNLTHQFQAHEDSILIELAYVKDGDIEENDIVRQKQGGKYINGNFYTLEQLKEINWGSNE